jgi:eukaryotic-like serine/threonine-protein kinase
MGDRIGRYKLLQRIGEGGCGVVFLAEQGEPVRRQVALKVIKPGMDTKSVIARFEAERQALALMEHPNIAQVFDAGSTDSGRPYFVMELVRGIKITEYCDRQSLSTAERLDLFMQVCHAVQHAHQKGIIHRDIKPSNVLVTTTEEGKPLPKVIDFGIAKATTGQQLTDKTIFTALEMLIGTPAYMSPEQAAMTNADVDTRTDIYSLGVLLYELLTGTTPFNTNELLKAGLDEVRRVIRNQEPVRPSTRLSTMLEGDLRSVSHHRHSEPPKLIREVRGDLDWIVMKALEKDPTRRYPTANGLAEDIHRYLANQGVLARPPSTLYKLRKLVARNKLLFAAIAAILVSLLVGLSIAIWSLAKERQARQDAEADKHRAEAAAAKSEQVTRFLEDMLNSAGPSVALGRDTTLLREILDRTGKRLEDELNNQPEIEADLRSIMGNVYQDIDAYDQAADMHRKALELRRAFLPADSPEVIMTVAKLAGVMLHEGKVDEAEKLAQEALNLWKQRGELDGLNATVAFQSLAMVRWQQRKLAEAESLMRQVIATRRRLGDRNADVLVTLNYLGNILFSEDRSVEAEQVFREELDVARKLYDPEHPRVANALHNVGGALASQKRWSEAKEYLSQSLELKRKLLGENHAVFVSSLAFLASVNSFEQNFTEAERLYREVLRLDHKPLDHPGSQRVVALEFLVKALISRDSRQEAIELLSEHLTPEAIGLKASLPLIISRAELYARQGKWKEAAADAAKALEHDPADHQRYHMLAPLLVAAGNLEEYRKLCGEIIARFRDAKDVFVADRMAKDCCILPLAGMDLQPAADLAHRAVSGGQGSTALPFFQACTAMAEYRLGHFENVAEWARRAVGSPNRHAQAEAGAVLAMAQFQLKQNDDARASLAQCAKVMEQISPAPPAGDLGSNWQDWIIAQTLLDEARTLITGEPPAGGNPKIKLLPTSKPSRSSRTRPQSGVR